MPRIEYLSAVTLGVADMAASTAFYEDLGFERIYGGPDHAFTSYRAGAGYLNLQAVEAPPETRWGRAIFHVDDVDAMFEGARAAGHDADFEPRDATWGERYFHIHDPDGHEISFARPL